MVYQKSRNTSFGGETGINFYYLVTQVFPSLPDDFSCNLTNGLQKLRKVAAYTASNKPKRGMTAMFYQKSRNTSFGGKTGINLTSRVPTQNCFFPQALHRQSTGHIHGCKKLKIKENACVHS